VISLTPVSYSNNINLLKYLIIGLFIASLLNFSQVIYLQIKASLAQVLLANAWENTLTITDKKVKPWPWADIYPVAKISIPSLDLTQIVLNNDSGQALAFGPGLNGYSNINDNLILISAHRDSHFKPLEFLNIGDEIHLETKVTSITKQVRFRVKKISVININEQSILDNNRPNTKLAISELILLTCYPFNSLSASTPYRLVIQAEETFFKRDNE